jgi:hypothetical protein
LFGAIVSRAGDFTAGAHAVLLICIGLLLASACVIALPPLRRRAASMVYGE